MKLRARGWVILGSRLIATAALSVSAANVQATFSVNLSFTGMSTPEMAYFTAAKSFWESVITGYAAGPMTGININASKTPIDGLGNTLGQAGPTASSFHGGYSYTSMGIMEFDSADMAALISNGIFGEVILHEMAHVIGFGTQWESNGLYSSSNPGQYLGTQALSVYQAEFNLPTAAFVPVELTGGPGTAEAHWAESADGLGPTGILDSMGRDFQHESLTGWLHTPTYISQTTIASFQDLGYTTVLSAVPEVSTVALWLLGLPLLVQLARQKRA